MTSSVSTQETGVVPGGDASARWRERDRRVVAPAYSRYTDIVVAEAEGAYIVDVDGRRYLDFGCGIAVTSLGHRHPDVTRAVHAQVDRYWHTSVVTEHELLVEAAEAVAGICPEPLKQVFFANSGAEVVEGALKLARRATGRQGIVCFAGGFHGRTFGAMSVTTSKVHYREGYAPLLPGVQVTPYPYCFRRCSHAANEPCPIAAGEQLEQLFARVVPAHEVAALLVEPIQGEGGYVVPPQGFLRNLRRICDQHGILLICDEVQSGMGRTGRWFAFEHEAVVPDIVTVAKALGSGLPIGAIVASPAVMRSWDPGSHGTTFGGNAVSCAAAVATIDVIRRDGLLARADAIGARIQEQARGWQQQGEVADVRGRGAMVGLEFMDSTGRPDAERVDQIKADCREQGMVVLSCGVDDNVIRLIPPLTLSDSELDQGLGILGEAVSTGRAVL